jgi:aspartate aminotransferase
MNFSHRMEPIKPSATLAVTSRAKELLSLGKDVLSFGAGEPDFDTPDFILDAMVEAARSGATRYAPVAGIPMLRQAVAEQFSDIYGLEFTSENIIVSCGGKHALFNLFQVLLNPGDEVLIPVPYWVSYTHQVRLAGGKPVTVPTIMDEGFRLHPDAVAEAIGEKTVGLVLNSPNNPTGAVLSADDLRAIADLAEQHDLWIISDDIYSFIRYESGPYASILRERPDLRDRMIVVHGASKTYAMTGWRVGFTAGSKALIKKLATLQGQSTSNATTFAQAGALAAVKSDHEFLKPWLAAYSERRQCIVRGLNDLEDVRCANPGGAFYVFPDMRGLLGRRLGEVVIESDTTLCKLLLEEVLVACVPGEPFGAPGFMRLSYACSMEDIERGLERIREFLHTLS